MIGRLGAEVEATITVDELMWWAPRVQVNLFRPQHNGKSINRPIDLTALRNGLAARGWITKDGL